MVAKIVVPPLGESITEATIASLHKKVGDFVQKDEVIGELETDKVTLEIYSVESGIISQYFVNVGDTVAIGTLIGTVDSSAHPVKTSTSTISSTNAMTDQKDYSIMGQKMPPTPSASIIATERNIDISNLSGSGKRGQVLKEDVLRIDKTIVEDRLDTLVPSTSNQNQNAKVDEPVERIKMSKLRQTISARLLDAQKNAAILTTFNEVDMSAVIKMRSDHKESFEKKYGIKLGFMSFFTKAVVVALKEIPTINAQVDGNEIIFKNYYHIGIAVGTEGGLVVPVVRHANQKSFADLEKEIVNLGTKARNGKLSVADMQGGTFTISNGGIYGSMLSTPILNPPQSGILGLHNIIQRPVAISGNVEIRPMMYLALSYDHRIIDGKEAVTFLVRVKQLIESPDRLLLDV